MSGSVKLAFLGGIEEIGKNMLALETEHDIIIVDCGVGFPEMLEQPGIDLLVPDIGYLMSRRDKIRGLLVTHGHEDHIGSIQWLWEDLRCPIYATPFTSALITSRLKERRLADKVELHEFDADARPELRAGDFTVEPFRVTHSIPDCVGFGITTPAGLIVMTGDFRFDEAPVDGKLSDIEKIRELGARGVKLLISECTNAERVGERPAEATLQPVFDDIIANAPGRVLVATFSSQIARIQQVMNAAATAGRRVSVVGRSMENNTRIATDVGVLRDNADVLLPAKIGYGQPEKEMVFVVTGSQGEENAVLNRVANRDHQKLTVGEGDTVVISSTPIPGNESAIFRMIDLLFLSGADVIYPPLANVHVSGHAYRDELREMVQLVQPEWVIPTHGEPRMRALFADLCTEEGIPRDRIIIPSLGQLVTMEPDRVAITGEFETGTNYVEGELMGDGNEMVLSDRTMMGQDGIVTIALAINWRDGEVVDGPKVLMRGFSSIGENRDLEPTIADAVTDAIDRQLQHGDTDGIDKTIRDAAHRVISKRSRQRPVVLPVVLDVNPR